MSGWTQLGLLVDTKKFFLTDSHLHSLQTELETNLPIPAKTKQVILVGGPMDGQVTSLPGSFPNSLLYAPAKCPPLTALDFQPKDYKAEVTKMAGYQDGPVFDHHVQQMEMSEGPPVQSKKHAWKLIEVPGATHNDGVVLCYGVYTGVI
jgi:hypothetical protein